MKGGGIAGLLFTIAAAFGCGKVLYRSIMDPLGFGLKALKNLAPYIIGIGVVYWFFPTAGIILALIFCISLFLMGIAFVDDK